MCYVRRITNPSIAPVILMINNYNVGNLPGKRDHRTSIPNAHKWDISGPGLNLSVSTITILLDSFKSHMQIGIYHLCDREMKDDNSVLLTEYIAHPCRRLNTVHKPINLVIVSVLMYIQLCFIIQPYNH